MFLLRTGNTGYLAQGYAIPYRLQNIIYFSYYIFLVFVLFYYLGYLEKKYHIWAKIEGIETIFASQKARTVTLLVMICILCFSFVGQIRIEGDEDKKAQILNLPVTMSAVYSLMTGEAKTYNEECKQRLQIYEDTSVEIAEVDPFSAMPELLYHSDVTTSKKHWRNEHVAMYYHKKYVVLKD